MKKIYRDTQNFNGLSRPYGGKCIQESLYFVMSPRDEQGEAKPKKRSLEPTYPQSKRVKVDDAVVNGWIEPEISSLCGAVPLFCSPNFFYTLPTGPFYFAPGPDGASMHTVPNTVVARRSTPPPTTVVSPQPQRDPFSQTDGVGSLGLSGNDFPQTIDEYLLDEWTDPFGEACNLYFS